MGKNIIVACGGTGGHSFPGLAVAKVLAARGHHVTVWMSGRNIESSVLKGWEGEVFATGARQLHPKNAFGILHSIWRCHKEIKRVRPDAVLAMGSYSSLPPVLAASCRHVPVVLHEANAVPGRAIEFLAHFASAVAVSFRDTSEFFSGCETVLTGLPVRSDIASGNPFDEIPNDAFTVFITGGSQGAHRVNEIAADAMVMLSRELEKTGRRLFVIHQTGVADEARIAERYSSVGIAARVRAFEHEMNRAFASASVVVARAGASTCFELALTGKPAFLIPLPSAMRNHQHLNAIAFTSVQAAAEGIQDELQPRALAAWLFRKAEHPSSLAEMSRRMLSLAVPNAADMVADLVERYCNE